MKADDINTAAVLGAGTMGHGIAQVLAMAGIATRLFDVDGGAIEGGLAKIHANLDKGVERGKVEAATREAALGLLSGSTDLARAVEGVQLVIEAVPEKMELKRPLFAELSERLEADVLLAGDRRTWRRPR